VGEKRIEDIKKGQKMDEIITAISTVGFPIVMCAYLVVRLEPIIWENTKATKENNALVRELKILVQALNGK